MELVEIKHKTTGWTSLPRTVIVRKGQDIALIIDPGLNSNKISHERRDGTLQNGSITPDNILGHNLRLIELIDNCKGVQ